MFGAPGSLIKNVREFISDEELSEMHVDPLNISLALKSEVLVCK
jgi:hypothetical protein